MKLFKKIVNLIEDDKNLRVLERLLIILYLYSLEFVAVAVGVGGVGGVVAVVAVAVVAVGVGGAVVGAVAVVAVGVGGAVGEPNMIIYLVIAEIVITIIAELLCYIRVREKNDNRN